MYAGKESTTARRSASVIASHAACEGARPALRGRTWHLYNPDWQRVSRLLDEPSLGLRLEHLSFPRFLDFLVQHVDKPGFRQSIETVLTHLDLLEERASARASRCPRTARCWCSSGWGLAALSRTAPGGWTGTVCVVKSRDVIGLESALGQAVAQAIAEPAMGDLVVLSIPAPAVRAVLMQHAQVLLELLRELARNNDRLQRLVVSMG